MTQHLRIFRKFAVERGASFFIELMKRKILLILFTTFSLFSLSQTNETIFIENGFKASGSMNMYWESTNTDDINPADNGSRWHLEVNNDIISFWIDCPHLDLYELSKMQWSKDEAALVYNKTEGNRIVYTVAKPPFKHLSIFEYDKNKWLVHLCSYIPEN